LYCRLDLSDLALDPGMQLHRLFNDVNNVQ
jgi:hypothetical protein